MSAMAFKFKKKLNHSPQWYAERCRNENAAPIIHAMLKRDMTHIDADYDTRAIDTERIDVYRERWEAIMNGAEIYREPLGGVHRQEILKSEMMDVVEREAMAGFRPSDQFKDEPFKTIDALMSEAGINENTMREFLRWRSRQKANAAAQITEVEVRTQEPASEDRARKTLRQRIREGHQFFD